MIDEKAKQFAASSLFPSLVLAAFGLVLAQAGAARMSGSWRLHAVLGIPGIALSGLALYRARVHWAAGIDLMPGTSAGGGALSTIRSAAWYLLLFGIGIALALSAGSILVLGIVASSLYLVPWAKIPVCRTRFIVSSMSTLAGAITWLAVYGKPIHGLHYLVAAWLVLILSMVMMFLVVLSLPYGYRVDESAEGAVVPDR